MIMVVPEKLESRFVGYKIEGIASVLSKEGEYRKIELRPKSIFVQTITEHEMKNSILESNVFNDEEITEALIEVFGIYRAILPDKFKENKCDTIKLFFFKKHFIL